MNNIVFQGDHAKTCCHSAIGELNSEIYCVSFCQLQQRHSLFKILLHENICCQNDLTQLFSQRELITPLSLLLELHLFIEKTGYLLHSQLRIESGSLVPVTSKTQHRTWLYQVYFSHVHHPSLNSITKILTDTVLTA